MKGRYYVWRGLRLILGTPGVGWGDLLRLLENNQIVINGRMVTRRGGTGSPLGFCCHWRYLGIELFFYFYPQYGDYFISPLYTRRYMCLPSPVTGRYQTNN